MKVIPLFVALGLAAMLQGAEVKLSAVANPRSADSEHTRPAVDKNAKGAPIALRIANHLLTKGTQ